MFTLRAVYFLTIYGERRGVNSLTNSEIFEVLVSTTEYSWGIVACFLVYCSRRPTAFMAGRRSR